MCIASDITRSYDIRDKSVIFCFLAPYSTMFHEIQHWKCFVSAFTGTRFQTFNILINDQMCYFVTVSANYKETIPSWEEKDVLICKDTDKWLQIIVGKYGGNIPGN